MQNRNKDIDIENKHMDTKRKRSRGKNWETGADIYTILHMKQLVRTGWTAQGTTPRLCVT